MYIYSPQERLRERDAELEVSRQENRELRRQLECAEQSPRIPTGIECGSSPDDFRQHRL